MRKFIMLLGTLLIAAVLIISGSAVAIWHHGLVVVDYYQCTDETNITGSPDGENATIGVDTPLYGLGWIIVDLGFAPMGPGQKFWVFASSRVEEEYKVYVGETDEFNDFVYIDKATDKTNHDFDTPGDPGKEWRYIRIDGWSGSYDLDSHYGPEIDAVGWYET